MTGKSPSSLTDLFMYLDSTVREARPSNLQYYGLPEEVFLVHAGCSMNMGVHLGSHLSLPISFISSHISQNIQVILTFLTL